MVVYVNDEPSRREECKGHALGKHLLAQSTSYNIQGQRQESKAIVESKMGMVQNVEEMKQVLRLVSEIMKQLKPANQIPNLDQMKETLQKYYPPDFPYHIPSDFTKVRTLIGLCIDCINCID